MTCLPRPEDLFAGVVDDYIRHRPPYPDELIDTIADRFALGPGCRVLDVGCGPAVLSTAFAATGAEVVGLDPSAEMLEAGARIAGEWSNLRLVQATAEDAPLDGPFRLAIFGRSFHWVDRSKVLARLDKVIERAGGGVVLRELRPSETAAPWRAIIAELERSWLPEGATAHRRHAEHRGDAPHEEVLEQSAFSHLETWDRPTSRAWTIDAVIGYVCSTSGGREALLAPEGPTREAELRKTLERLDRLDEQVIVRALIATRGRK